MNDNITPNNRSFIGRRLSNLGDSLGGGLKAGGIGLALSLLILGGVGIGFYYLSGLVGTLLLGAEATGVGTYILGGLTTIGGAILASPVIGAVMSFAGGIFGIAGAGGVAAGLMKNRAGSEQRAFDMQQDIHNQIQEAKMHTVMAKKSHQNSLQEAEQMMQDVQLLQMMAKNPSQAEANHHKHEVAAKNEPSTQIMQREHDGKLQERGAELSHANS